MVGFHVYVMWSTQNKLKIIEARKVYYWQLYSIWYVVSLQSSNPFLFNQHRRLSTEILDEFISMDSTENNTRRDNFQQFLSWNIGDTTENKPVLYQKLEFNRCSLDSVNHCQFGEHAAKLSFSLTWKERHRLLCLSQVLPCAWFPCLSTDFLNQWMLVSHPSHFASSSSWSGT